MSVAWGSGGPRHAVSAPRFAPCAPVIRATSDWRLGGHLAAVRGRGCAWTQVRGLVGMTATSHEVGAPTGPVAVCLLGGFRLLKLGELVDVRPGGKTQALLSALALRRPTGVAREELIGSIWPTSDAALGGQSLNTLVSSV